MRLKITSAISLLSLLVSMIPSFATTQPAYSPRHLDYPGTQVVYHVSEGSPRINSDLSIFVSGRVSSVDQQKIIICRFIGDKHCENSGENRYSAFSLMPKCEGLNSENCLESLSITDENDKFVEATFVREVGGYTIPADEKIKYVGGRRASIWNAQTAVHSGNQSSYLVIPQLDSYYQPESGKFIQTSLSVAVVPFIQKYGAFESDRFVTDSELIQRENEAGISNSKYVQRVMQRGTREKQCLFYDDGTCGIQYDFKKSARIKVSLRISKELGGWFKGRIQDPKIQIDSISTEMNRLTIEGINSEIPRMVHLVPWGSSSEEDKNNFVKYFWGGGIPEDLLAGPIADEGQRVFEFINSFRAKVKDTSSGFTTAWNFSTVAAGQGSRCLSDTSKVLGVVTTNSMGYEGSAPGFANGTLDYRVGGLHFAPDGKTEIKGTYDLIMRSEVARCLYGFTNAPISATISITSDGGEAAVATTKISEEDGWLKLGAYNFTFSNPTLRVKLSQVQPEQPKIEVPKGESQPTTTQNPQLESAAAKPQTVVAKKKSITCVKGKVSKKVSGVNPKCPTGFKKK